MVGVRRSFSVAAIRTAESAALAATGEGELMSRAARGLAVTCAELLSSWRGRVTGSRVVVLAGTGNNAGDALFAAAELGRRGAAVAVITLAGTTHPGGLAAALAHGARLVDLGGVEVGDPLLQATLPTLSEADLVLDGIVGIGGSGPLRPVAATLAAAAAGRIVAVDLPSGVNPDTGEVPDPDACVSAEVTVTFGALKTGLLLPPASVQAGLVSLVDIGLGPYLAEGDEAADAVLMDMVAAGDAVPVPGGADDKYTRGVLGVVAGSEDYPGAGILCSGAGRFGGVGMVRYAGGAVDQVVTRWPEIVPSRTMPSKSGRVQAWVIGSGAGVDDTAKARLADVLAAQVPIVVDADAITLVSADEDLRTMVRDRTSPTLFTPHAGEFARLGGDLSVAGGRLAAVRRLAADLDSVVLLKGAVTVIAGANGSAVVSASGPPDLATAGSGDVLSGLIGSLVAANHVADSTDLARVAGAGAYLHGVAARLAAAGGRPIVSEDVLTAVPDAVALARNVAAGG